MIYNTNRYERVGEEESPIGPLDLSESSLEISLKLQKIKEKAFLKTCALPFLKGSSAPFKDCKQKTRWFQPRTTFRACLQFIP